MLPILYHTVELDAVAKSVRPESFLFLNAGHRHVRKLVVHWPDDIAKVETFVSCLTAALPRDTLEAFQCDSWSPTLGAIYQRLYPRQRQLEDIVVFHVGNESDGERSSSAEPMSAQTTSVQNPRQYKHAVLLIDGRLRNKTSRVCRAWVHSQC